MNTSLETVTLKKIVAVILALAIIFNVYSGSAQAQDQGTATLKISTTSIDSTFGEEVTFNVTALDPIIGGRTPSGTVTIRDGNQDLMSVGLTTAEPLITTTACGSSCPLIQWGEYTFRAYSFGDNRIAMNIVTYDASGMMIHQLEKPGARYLSDIKMDAAAQTFTFWGQDNMTVTVGWGELLSATSSASFTTSDLAIGTHTITAAYSGDDTHPASETTTTVTVHPKYTVVYDGNGSTGGDVPANSSSYNGIKASISSNNGSLVRSGYTFGGWNTQADGLGVDYSADAEGVITSDVTLYVKWIKTLDVGTGTASDPYQITTAEELNTVRNYLDPDLYFKLAADIDLSSYGEAWLPIGEGVHGRFRGHIDGNGHKITGLTINRPNDNYAGLFGYITYDASVSNVILENVNVTGRQYVGGLAGRIDGGGISNSSVSGSVKGTGTMVGGMIGYNYYGTVNNSFATAHITGNSNNVGGLVGSNFGEISYGYAVGNVTGNGNNIGGLVGNNGGEINYSYAAGGVTGSGSNIGGLIGNNSSGPISNSFYDSGTTGQSDVDKGIGRSSTEMKTQSTYEDSNWDFTSRWGISPSHNNGYPYLQAIQKFVTYDGNGNIGGSAPTDSKSYAPGETVHVYSDTVTLMKPHYTFAGWNTQADGSGTDYAPGVAFSMSSSDLTLYAKWIPNLTYKVTYNDNGSTGGSVPTDSGSYEEGDTVSVSGNNGNLEKTGYTFAGWNTAADGSGISYAREMNFLMGTQHVTLYAQWVSANALLSGLSLEHGVLQFSPTQTNYAVRVEHSVTNLSLFLNTEDATQSLKVTGADYDSVTGNKYTYNASSLIVGPNTVQITVTAHDGSHTTYVVTITREGILGEPMPLDPSVRTLAFPGGLVIELPDGLVIPEGAILTVRNSDAVPSGEIKLAKAGQVIDFQFEGMTITQPVQITLGYDESADRSKLAIYYYNESTGKWEYRPSQVTDHGAKTTVNHFSTYGVLADTTAPDQVIITSGAKTTHSITLHLAANDDSGVAKYRIYRDGILLVETTESTFVDTGLSASKQYIYTAKAVDRLGNISDASEGITVKTNSDGGSSTPGGGSYTAPPPAIGPKVAGTDGRLTLPAGQAGEVSYSDEIKIVIPAGAASRELIVTIDKVSDSDVKTLITSKDALVSPVFEIQKNVVENFDKPVSISFTLDLSSLKDNEKPVVFYYEEAKKEWVRVGGTVSGNSITVEVDHFTKFAVFAVADAPLPTTEDTTKVSFSDITGHWAEARIKQAVSAGIVGGYPDHTFKPGRTVTRAEFAVMLMNALGPQGAGAALAFTDKALIGAWAQQSIAQAVNAGIITGYEDGSFRPNAEITRAEMATMIAKALGLTDRTTETSGFADDQDIPDWARGAVAIIKNLGIIEGKGANQFAPGDKTTRAEAVSVLLKMLEQKNK